METAQRSTIRIRKNGRRRRKVAIYTCPLMLLCFYYFSLIFCFCKTCTAFQSSSSVSLSSIITGRTKKCDTIVDSYYHRHHHPCRRLRNHNKSSTTKTSKSSSSSSSSSIHMIPESFHAASEILASAATAATGESSSNALNSFLDVIPFKDAGLSLYDSLDIGGSLLNDAKQEVPEVATTIVLESIGHDLLVFLLASVIVSPICKTINVTPILGYLIIGAMLGPNGLDLFANSRADIEFGDFGILFLLFSEGLEVSKSRLKKLTNYLPLGLAQISLVTGVITFSFIFGIPTTLAQIFHIPLSDSVMAIDTPVKSVVLAMAACLSTSAFIFPVLKERGWEDENSGEAATSILLLQDLMVAPLLVILPFLVGESDTNYGAIAFLTAKATIGFGSVIVLGSFVLQKVFSIVAKTESPETFVALCLLVSAGMGAAAKTLGLTDTAGAFAAGVLLANTNYRAQIQADILPFKGILLGIFFMGAGSNFDTNLVLSEFPTIFSGVLALIFVKATTLGVATRVPETLEPNRLNAVDAIRVSLLLSGGGEFAFVVLALAEKLGVVPADLASVTTAVILITMGITPLLGELAVIASKPFEQDDDSIIDIGGIRSKNGLKAITNGSNTLDDDDDEEKVEVASDSIVICGYGEVGRSLIRVLGAERGIIHKYDSNFNQKATIVAFDTISSLMGKVLMPGNETAVLYGNGANAELLRSYGITKPNAIFITYKEHSRLIDTTERLRTSFPEIPIYTRAGTQREARQLRKAGATHAVVESDELPRFAPQLTRGIWEGNLPTPITNTIINFDDDEDNIIEELRNTAAAASGLSIRKVDEILEIYKSMDIDGSGYVLTSEVEEVLDRSGKWIASDKDVQKLNKWVEEYLFDTDSITAVELCCMYAQAPEFVQKSFGIKSSKDNNNNKSRISSIISSKT